MENIIETVYIFWKEVAAIVILSIMGIFYKHLKAKIKKFIEYLAKVIYMNGRRDHDDILNTLEKIQAELHSNGGKSLRDAINKIDNKLGCVANKINLLKVNTEILSDMLDICRWYADENGCMLYINRSTRKLLGLLDDQLFLNDAWINNIVYIDDRNVTENEWRRAIKSKTEFHHNFRMINQMSKGIINVDCQGRVVLDEKNEITGWSGIITPVERV